MDGISSAFDRVVSDSYFKIAFVPQRICAMTGVFLPLQTHWCSSRFTQRPAATRLHDFNLTDDSAEDADLPEGFHRLQSPDRSRCKIFLLLLGLLVMFVIGTRRKSLEYTFFYFSHLWSPPIERVRSRSLTRLPGW